ncbi:hypothetical protein FQZ97_1061710 [compost metagenome]
MANGMEAKMPAQVPMVNSLEPAQPLAVKLAIDQPGATTPANTSSSATASRVTTSSNIAAMPTPSALRVMKIT